MSNFNPPEVADSVLAEVEKVYREFGGRAVRALYTTRGINDRISRCVSGKVYINLNEKEAIAYVIRNRARKQIEIVDLFIP